MKNNSSVSAEQVKKALDTKANIIFLDVRTAEEYKQGHLENSILLPVDTVAKKAQSIFTDKNKILYVYCLSGSRSAQATKTLRKLGFVNTFNMTSGLLAWKAKGYPLTQHRAV